jgi:hypothetical protein
MPETNMNKDQDLTWHKNEDTEELVKSENPDKGYMENKSLCVKCHGPKRACEIPYCPQTYSEE